MIEFILVAVGLVLFVNQLFLRWRIYAEMEIIASECGSKFLYKLLNCRFCIRFYISLIVFASLLFVFGLVPNFFLVPFIVSGIVENVIKYK